MSIPATQPIIPAYASDSKMKPSLLYYYLVYLPIILIPAAIFLGFFLLVAPPFKEIFKDFKTALPTFTEWMLNVADLCRSGLWIPIALGALALPLLPAWLTTRQPYRHNRVMFVLITVILVLLAMMIFAALALVALFLPLIKLIQSVSGGPGP